MHIAPNSRGVCERQPPMFTRTDASVKSLDSVRIYSLCKFLACHNLCPCRGSRQCFFSDEHSLDSFSVYTADNCIHQCLAEDCSHEVATVPDWIGPVSLCIVLTIHSVWLYLSVKFEKEALRNTSFCEGERISVWQLSKRVGLIPMLWNRMFLVQF